MIAHDAISQILLKKEQQATFGDDAHSNGERKLHGIDFSQLFYVEDQIVNPFNA